MKLHDQSELLQAALPTQDDAASCQLFAALAPRLAAIGNHTVRVVASKMPKTAGSHPDE